MNLMFQPLRKYADFGGRARRLEYWSFLFLLLAVLLVFTTLLGFLPGGAQALESDAEPSGPVAVAVLILGLGYLGVVIPTLAVTIRRLHDTNRTGWWVLIRIIPFLGDLVLFVLTILDGTKGPNRFGSDPKGRGATVEVFD